MPQQIIVGVAPCIDSCSYRGYRLLPTVLWMAVNVFLIHYRTKDAVQWK
jgi:hypothetical protein